MARPLDRGARTANRELEKRGSLPVALLASAALARFLPLSPDARFAIGFALAIPAWVGVMCVTLLAESGLRALLVCAGLGAALAGLVYGIGF